MFSQPIKKTSVTQLISFIDYIIHKILFKIKLINFISLFSVVKYNIIIYYKLNQLAYNL